MKTKAILISILITLSMVLVSNSYALRCTSPTNGKNYLTSKGDYYFDVMRKCGQPEFFGTMGGVQSDVQVMTYTKDGMIETLHFRMGRLESESSNRDF